jgi:hypothetical protein
VDDLEAGNSAVWVVVAHEDDAMTDRPPLCEEACLSLAPLRICRAVRDDGTLLIGDADPDQCERMSDLLLVDHCGEA